MSVFTITSGFLEHKQMLHLRFLTKKEYGQLQHELESRFARIDPDPPWVASMRYDLQDATVVCGNDNVNPGDLFAVCLRAV